MSSTGTLEPQADQTEHEIPREASHEITGRTLPVITVDMDERTAVLPNPTVMSVPASIMARFDEARRSADSHTELVLDALEAAGARLPDLVLARRPKLARTGLFARADRVKGEPDRTAALRVRPTVAELDQIDQLVAWVDSEVKRERPGGRPVSRSEAVAAALHNYLPK